MSQPDAIPEFLLAGPRGGWRRVGPALRAVSQLSALIVRPMIDNALKLKLDASDLVQDTFLKAHRQFADFAGRDEPELMAWLRRILVRTLADQAKYHRSRAESSPAGLAGGLLEQAGGAAEQAWPTRSHRPVQWLSGASAGAPGRCTREIPADYREVFVLRNIDHIPFNDIATRWAAPRALPACSGPAPCSA